MSKEISYYCNICNCSVGQQDNGYEYEVYLSIRKGTDFIERNIHNTINNATYHICKDCTTKILEVVFSSRLDKNSKGKVCPKCGSNLACGYNVEHREHRYYCVTCSSSLKNEEVINESKS